MGLRPANREGFAFARLAARRCAQCCRRAANRPASTVLRLLALWLVALGTGGLAASRADAQALSVQVSRPAENDGVSVLLERVRQAVLVGDPALVAPLFDVGAASRNIEEFTARIARGQSSRVVLFERDRVLLMNGGYRVVVDIFAEEGPRGRIGTWQLEVKAGAATDPTRANEWRIVSQESMSQVEGLYRLALDTRKQYTVRNLTISAEDVAFVVPVGTAFVAENDDGPTALVVMGRSEMAFSPKPGAERTQVRLFCGEEVLRSAFDIAYIRLNPAELEAHLDRGALVERPVNGRDLKRAQRVFTEELPKSFGLDLSDLSPDTWSLTPPLGDFVAEVRTRRHGALTYAKSGSEAEDISLFNRKTRKNISMYSSVDRMASRGPFYDEDDLTTYDVEHYNLEVDFDPAREWIEGTARLRIRVRTFAAGTITLKLADTLTVRSVRSEKHGALLAVRVKEQNSVIVNLPPAMAKENVIQLSVAFGGRLPAPPTDREALALGTQDVPVVPDSAGLQPEMRLVYSTRSYWHPQAVFSDYATALMRLTVPPNFDLLATGDPAQGNPVLLTAQPNKPARKVYVFSAAQPVRYLSVAISRFQAHQESSVVELDPARVSQLPKAPDGSELRQFMIGSPRLGTNLDKTTVDVVANPRQTSRSEGHRQKAASILKAYSDILGDLPYSHYTVALVDNATPGGHSPGYFVILHQAMPTSPYMWRNDPVVFDEFPDFFLAHETAHQYFGQAVGWKNYHEQWISEGFAQYMAALYAEKTRPDSFQDIIRQMRRTAMDNSDQGPVFLGYRLGHVRGEGRVFRAIVYNKGAMVIHMARRWLGDEVFFKALRRFYREFRFRKAGAEDFRKALEAESGQSLQRFFQRWVYEAGLPELGFSYTEGGGAAPPSEATGPTAHQASLDAGVTLRFEQRGAVIYDIPITVTLRYESGATEDIVVRVNDAVTEMRVPAKGPVRDVRVNEDGAALAEVRR
jgi:hypothetical protein